MADVPPSSGPCCSLMCVRARARVNVRVCVCVCGRHRQWKRHNPINWENLWQKQQHQKRVGEGWLMCCPLAVRAVRLLLLVNSCGSHTSGCQTLKQTTNLAQGNQQSSFGLVWFDEFGGGFFFLFVCLFFRWIVLLFIVGCVCFGSEGVCCLYSEKGDVFVLFSYGLMFTRRWTLFISRMSACVM